MFCAHVGARKIFLQNPLIVCPALRHHVRAFLTKTQAVAEAAAAKHEIRSVARDFKSGTLQQVPSQDAAHNYLEIPSAHDLSMFAVERDDFCTSGFIALAESDLIES